MMYGKKFTFEVMELTVRCTASTGMMERKNGPTHRHGAVDQRPQRALTECMDMCLKLKQLHSGNVLDGYFGSNLNLKMKGSITMNSMRQPLS
ncbi:MAG: hypothetical protein ACRKFN_11505 [Desulfitobacterium sp.]